VSNIIRSSSRKDSRHSNAGRLLLPVAFSLFFAGLVTMPTTAFAQDATYSADDVSRHFKQLKTRSLKPTGTTRALCIGTRDECDQNDAKEGGGQIAVTPDTSASDNNQSANALTPDPETKAIGEGFNLLVSFEYASARLSPTAKTNLREFSKGIADPELSSAAFLIEGHTDGIGSVSYNQRLSEDRAQAVTEYLISLGVSRKRLKTIGYGKTRPRVADINDPTNRRVESKMVLE
jgi:OmpA-OmpF porin, OOP family